MNCPDCGSPARVHPSDPSMWQSDCGADNEHRSEACRIIECQAETIAQLVALFGDVTARVRVLEEAINHHRSMLCGPGFDRTADVILWKVTGC